MFKLMPRLSHVAFAAVAVLSAVPAMAQDAQYTTQIMPTQSASSALAMPGTPVRVIPADAPLARMELARPSATDPLQAKIDGKVVGVAPGLRIFSTDTLLLSPAAIANRKLDVRYKLDLYGQLLTAWVLTDAEVKAWKAAH